MAVAAQIGVGVSPAESTEEFSSLVREYRLRAFHFALQLVGNREDAMDATQEAFIKAHRNWHRRDPDRPFAPWFYAVLRNVCIDLLRKRVSRREDDAEAIPDVSPRPGPESLAQKNQLKEKVWLAISQLPEAQREVVVLRDLHGFAYKEIAEITGQPLTTVNARLRDARETLRLKLRRFM